MEKIIKREKKKVADKLSTSCRQLFLCKKAFAFSFLAIFLSFIIFTFGSLYLFKGDYTKGDQVKDSRLSYLNNEIKYFKNIYFPTALKFSYYNTINSILQNKTYLTLIENNYSKLNDLVYEGITNGSLNGVHQINLENKTINYFLSEFQVPFTKNYLGNFEFNISKINIYQTNAYTLSLQAKTNYYVTTLDNISLWNFKEEIFITIPVYGLKDPQFFLYDNLNYTIRPVDSYATNLNWSASLLNETLTNVYSNIYLEPSFKYTLGNNFLSEMLNISRSSYDNVLAFFSFDYDEEKNFVYDTSQNILVGKHFGNTKLLLNFDDETANDLSVYQNNGTLVGGMSCTINASFDTGCEFDGVNDFIEITNSVGLNFSDNFSISIWIKTNDSTSNPTRIIGYDNDYKLFLESGNLGFILNDNIASKISYNNISDNTWHQITTTYNNNIAKLYIDGISFDSSTQTITSSSVPNFFIGSKNGTSEFYKGEMDEVAIYSKALSQEEITDLYDSKQAKFIDYKNSLFGKAIKFDGVDDYVNINYLKNYNLENYSIEFWIKPYLNNSMPIVILKNSTNSLRFFFNEQNKLEVDISPNNIGNLISNYSINQWNYFTLISNSTNAKLYRNGELVDEKIINFSFYNFNNLSLGYNNSNLFFNGLIDEIKIYNRTLTDEEIEQNYYNYASFSKGCCNYLTLINPNLMDYNTAAYIDNISYSSKLFYDYYKRGGNLNPSYYNMTLLNVTNITSYITTNDFYNFIVDDCLLQAYSISNYDEPPWDYHKEIGAYNFSCINLIKAGIY